MTNDLTLVRNNIQNLLLMVDDELILQQFYNALVWLSKGEEGKVWQTLSNFQQEEVMEAYEESENPENLITHEDAKLRHSKWLTKSLSYHN